MHGCPTVRASAIPNLFISRQDLAMVTAIASQHDVLIRPSACESHQVSSHVSWSVQKEETAISEEVVGTMERPKWHPGASLVREFADPGVGEDDPDEFGVWISGVAGVCSCFGSRSDDDLAVGEFGGVADVVPVEVTECWT